MAFIKRLRAKNVLSFGGEGIDLELRDLNVIIGANSSGKSNLVSLLSLLQAAPTDVTKPVGAGGGTQEWLWKGGAHLPDATLEVVVAPQYGSVPLRYVLSFREEAQRFSLIDERIEPELPVESEGKDSFFYRYRGGGSQFNVVTPEMRGYGRHSPPIPAGRGIREEPVQPNQSILVQRRGAEQYPEITYLGEAFSQIRIYQDWQFGRTSPARLPQRPDMPNDFLLEDASNLALVIDDIKFAGGQAAELRDFLQLANPEFNAIHTRVFGGTIQLYIEETGLSSPTPATRLSQGALQLICLLVILLHPRPPKVVCIEEPEKGLHPDLLPELARLLVRASTRTQLIVTTHSEILVDALSDSPESIIVCEKQDGSTKLRRLSTKELSDRLTEGDGLGRLWRQGSIGGNRW